MAEAKSMYEKLATMRVELQKEKLTKSGLNIHSNFKYYNLDDFLPSCNEISLKNKVFLKFEFNKEIAKLIALNIENKDDYIEFSIPVTEVSVIASNGMQNIGAVTTYARRYLYMIAFEIAENDDFDTTEATQKRDKEEKERIEFEKKQAEALRQPISAIKLEMINKEIARTGISEKAVCDRYKVEKLEAITENIFATVIKSLKATPDKPTISEEK